MSDRTKAKIIGIGKPGQPITFVAPKPKSVFEFNFWVLAYKFNTSIGMMALMIFSAIAVSVSLKLFIAVLCVSFIVNMIMVKPCP